MPADTFPNGTEAKELVRMCLFSNYHPVCTCAMGKKEVSGVIDERLRVCGAKGLRLWMSECSP